MIRVKKVNFFKYNNKYYVRILYIKDILFKESTGVYAIRKPLSPRYWLERPRWCKKCLVHKNMEAKD